MGDNVTSRSKLRLLGAPLLLLAALAAAPTAASAATSPAGVAPAVTCYGVGPAEPIQDGVAQMTVTTQVKIDGIVQPSCGTTYNYSSVACNHAYTWTATYTVMTYQHSCTGTTSPWGVKLTASAQALSANGLVSETGMAWLRNGIVQGTQAPHPGYPAGYQFHGTFNPVHANDLIHCSDSFTFTTSAGGVGTIFIACNLHQN
jgi:hypothetical protein